MDDLVTANAPGEVTVLMNLSAPLVPNCRDGIDNDGDGFTDFVGDDPGCDGADDPYERSGALPCDNGLDDDGDGLPDLRDPGCAVPHGDREDPQCDDGVDNDGDGATDFEDSNWSAIWPYWESAACGCGAELALLLPPILWLHRRRRGSTA